ncbi:MAG: tetratricopeptide repeat protein [Candidatus Stygibacter australis]|nr:tetratricopeptide repeat protein [Candidatus Stygibacter australis]MDP8320808.1 tetratricopeptide repeat protein [Candidatus Stygibacter australis]
MKGNILGLILLILAAGLFGQAHDQSEYDEYQKYQTDPTLENFKSALDYYSTLDNETGKLLTAYLYYSELEKALDELGSEPDSLTMKTKFNYANLLLDLGRYDECIPIYESLNAESPVWACPWRHKGEALWKSGNLDDAEAALKQSIEVRENHYDAYVMLAHVLLEQGKAQEALTTLERGMQYGAENPEYSENEEFEAEVKALHDELIKMSSEK